MVNSTREMIRNEVKQTHKNRKSKIEDNYQMKKLAVENLRHERDRRVRLTKITVNIRVVVLTPQALTATSQTFSQY